MQDGEKIMPKIGLNMLAFQIISISSLGTESTKKNLAKSLAINIIEIYFSCKNPL